MPAVKEFLDTNIFAYALDARDGAKKLTAATLIVELLRGERAVTSYQVVQEFVNVAMRSAIPGFGVKEAHAYLRESFARIEIVSPTLGLFEEAMEIQTKYQFHWYDSLIVAAALEAGCETLYTEDLHNGQMIEGMMIVNPFISSP